MRPLSVPSGRQTPQPARRAHRPGRSRTRRRRHSDRRRQPGGCRRHLPFSRQPQRRSPRHRRRPQPFDGRSGRPLPRRPPDRSGHHRRRLHQPDAQRPPGSTGSRQAFRLLRSLRPGDDRRRPAPGTAPPTRLDALRQRTRPTQGSPTQRYGRQGIATPARRRGRLPRRLARRPHRRDDRRPRVRFLRLFRGRASARPARAGPGQAASPHRRVQGVAGRGDASGDRSGHVDRPACRAGTAGRGGRRYGRCVTAPSPCGRPAPIRVARNCRRRRCGRCWSRKGIRPPASSRCSGCC